ncbi:MAG TPA: molybdenum cofactor biosynthesis protein MoaE, partial [Verrucomicrobiae bacterium]|nr:molybdenum cofactor biosynthesis protein MoaE [Verrucomicrobiae bacterium]
MKRHLTITNEPIKEVECVAGRELSGGMGAVVSFLGYVRNAENESVISGLEYEAFQPMVEHQFQLLFDQIEARWPIESVRLIHRIGVVRVNEPSLW